MTHPHDLHKNWELQKEIESLKAKLQEALERIRDCDWVITPHDRMDAVRAIAREEGEV